LRQIDQARGDLYGIADDLDFIKIQLARLPTRKALWRAALMGTLSGSALTISLALAFWH
jgi:hypothetical protein